MQALFAITSTVASVSAGGTIPLDQTARRVSQEIQLSSNSVQATGNECRGSYFKVSGTITFTAPAAGEVTVSLRKNGIAVPSVTTSATVTTATTQVITLPIDGIVRVDRGETGVFTLVNDGVAITVSNVALSFLRIF